MTEKPGHRVTTDASLELVCTLAYEAAVRTGDPVTIANVEDAIISLRTLKVEPTGVFEALREE